MNMYLPTDVFSNRTSAIQVKKQTGLQLQQQLQVVRNNTIQEYVFI
jgi:hypothetical protein